MQVVVRRFAVFAVIWSAMLAPGFSDPSLQDIRPRPLSSALEAVRRGDWIAAERIASRDVPISADIIAWQRLIAGREPHEKVVAFLERRPDWPSLKFIRKSAEAGLSDEDHLTILDFFAENAPQTPQGALVLAKALAARGDQETAEKTILNAWLTLSLDDRETKAFLEAYPALLKKNVGARLDAMLWRGWIDNAQRLIPRASPDDVAVARARIALQRRSKAVDALVAKVPKSRAEDAGLARDRFEWRVRKGRWVDSKALLQARSKSAELLGEPVRWANRRRALARDELRDGSAKKAYALASQHHLTQGSHYADLEWLSGYIALTQLNDPATALQHFENHDDAVVSPISQGRAGYWKGRAHQALGDIAAADQAFASGAAYQTSFYGLLAAEAAGLPFDVGLSDVPKEAWRDSPLASDSLFQAGLVLASSGERALAERFWVHLAEQLGAYDAALLGQAAIDVGEPHLAVMIGKAVARRGDIIPIPYFPLHPLADLETSVPTELALAVARRESEFDPEVVSPVGARGLMQLMPATAKSVAASLGLAATYAPSQLTADPLLNARLGSKYLSDLSRQFSGNPVLMAAGYNAGPSRPERWTRLYGDPRGRDIDTVIAWIEGIPFRETRNYVMRVTEGLPIYRARLGKDPLPVPFSQTLSQ